jgi:hypothetical protein
MVAKVDPAVMRLTGKAFDEIHHRRGHPLTIRM